MRVHVAILGTRVNNVLRAACTFRNRAVSVVACRQAHAGGFDRPAGGGSLSCRGQAREKSEDNARKRERCRKCADDCLAGLHPSEPWNTHIRATFIRTRAQPLHTRTTTDTPMCALARTRASLACTL